MAAAAPGYGYAKGGSSGGSPPSSQIQRRWRAEAAWRVDAAAALPGGGREVAAAALPSRSGAVATPAARSNAAVGSGDWRRRRDEGG